jgi:alpha-L-fucosidase
VRAEPTGGQKRQMGRGYGMFCHYGMNTYLDVEWSEGKAGVEVFDPPVDLAEKVDGWAALAKAAGMRYLLYTTKHHDGFCYWPTKGTDYHSCAAGVRNKVDVVGAVAAACRRHGVEMGMYYSLWDRHEASYKDADKHTYIEWMKGQLGELLTNYGDICELWLDGEWDRKPEDWFLPEVYGLVKELQAGCQVGVNHCVAAEPEKQREGEAMKLWPSDFRLHDPHLPVEGDPKVFVDGEGRRVYLPFESTVTMSRSGSWFAHESEPEAKGVEELEGIYRRARLGGNMLVLNISPRRDGSVWGETSRNLLELARRAGGCAGVVQPGGGARAGREGGGGDCHAEGGDPVEAGPCGGGK